MSPMMPLVGQPFSASRMSALGAPLAGSMMAANGTMTHPVQRGA